MTTRRHEITTKKLHKDTTKGAQRLQRDMKRPQRAAKPQQK